MKQLSIREVQLVQLDILKEVADFCDKHKIKYMLGCGTLCGAVVRESFFPWDNDIDILIPREDYDRFINIFKSSNLDLMSEKDDSYYYPYAKVISNKTIAYECKVDIPNYGVFIDVFPIDGVPNDIYLPMLKPIKYLMMSQWGCYLEKRNVLVKAIYFILSKMTLLIPKNFFAKRLNKICRKYNIDNCKKAGVVVHHKKRHELVDSSVFKKRTKVIFEGLEFYGPYEYDKYLKCLYGDYFIETDHDNNKYFRAYWKKDK